MVLEKTLESSLDCKEIKPVCSKGNQSWIFIDWCWSWNSNTLATWCEELIHLKRPWCWERVKEEEKGITECEMFGWHHWLDGHESEQALGVGDGQRCLVCFSPWGRKELDMTKWLNWTEIRQNGLNILKLDSLHWIQAVFCYILRYNLCIPLPHHTISTQKYYKHTFTHQNRKNHVGNKGNIGDN